MKKLIQIKYGLLASALLSVFFVSPKTFADGNIPGATITVNEIEVSGLQSFKGQYLSAYYVRGFTVPVSTSKEQIHMLEVLGKVTLPITGDVLDLAQQQVVRKGNFIMNMVVLVIHAKRDFVWTNLTSGGSVIPDGEKPVPGASTIYTGVDFIRSSDQSLIIDPQAGPVAPIMYPFGYK